MPRTARVAPGGMVFHVLNRGVARMQLFEKPTDFQAFERVLRETRDVAPMRICAGRAYGDDATARRTSGRCWRTGRSIAQRIGLRGSIKPTLKRNWSRYDRACSEAVRSASRNGRNGSRNAWAWSRPIVPPVAREKWANAKSSQAKTANRPAKLPRLPISDLSRFCCTRKHERTKSRNRKNGRSSMSAWIRMGVQPESDFVLSLFRAFVIRRSVASATRPKTKLGNAASTFSNCPSAEMQPSETHDPFGSWRAAELPYT